ncbi:MAG: hypothetical protein ABWJ42_04250 [Sulfolobales archaeon]
MSLESGESFVRVIQELIEREDTILSVLKRTGDEDRWRSMFSKLRDSSVSLEEKIYIAEIILRRILEVYGYETESFEEKGSMIIDSLDID